MRLTGRCGRVLSGGGASGISHSPEQERTGRADCERDFFLEDAVWCNTRAEPKLTFCCIVLFDCGLFRFTGGNTL